MRWFAYTPFPVENGFEHLETVEETAKWYSSEGLRTKRRMPSPFNHSWEEAQQAAMKAGWNGKFIGAAGVFWMPTSTGFNYGFAWRQDDETGVMVSPVALHHLERTSPRVPSGAVTRTVTAASHAHLSAQARPANAASSASQTP
jgi:hypothetical protein